jgi:hypothetical protein
MIKAVVTALAMMGLVLSSLFVLAIPHILGMPDAPAAVLGMCLVVGYATFVGCVVPTHWV